MDVIEDPARRPPRDVAIELGPASQDEQTPTIVLPTSEGSSADIAERVEISIPVSQPPRTPAETHVARAAPPDESDGTGGIRLLLADVRVAGLVMNEARYRTLERLLGVRREQANAATAVAALMLAEVLHEKGKRLARGPALPSVGDSTLGLALVREGMYGAVGPSARDLPLAGTLLTVAFAAAIVGPGVRAAVHGARGSSHRANVAFRHRYGYLVHHGRRYARLVRSMALSEAGSATPAEDGNSGATERP